ncbi:MAG: FecR family protein [Bacteroidia bacterium]
MLQQHSDIDVLIAKKLSGEDLAEGKPVLDSWMDENPEAWLKAENSWFAAKSEWFVEGDSSLNIRPLYLQAKSSNLHVYRWVGLAASLILIAMISFFLIRENEVETYAVLSETKTLTGQQKEVVLPDGSKVRLNAASNLRFPATFAPDQREVYLEGEAYFEVVSDKKRPLIIHGTEANIKVLGTAFNVHAYPGTGMEVAVRTGKINMVSHSGSGTDVLMVPAGRKGVSYKSAGVWQVEPASEMDFDWLDGKMQFNESPLSEVMEELERSFGVEIEMADANLASCRISATFYRNSIEEVLETLSLIVDFTYEREGDRIVVSGKGC